MWSMGSSSSIGAHPATSIAAGPHRPAVALSDTSLFVYQRGSDTAFLLLYVDDIVLIVSSPGLLHRIISALQHEFAMKDLGELHHFLGMHVQRCGDGLLSQR